MSPRPTGNCRRGSRRIPLHSMASGFIHSVISRYCPVNNEYHFLAINERRFYITPRHPAHPAHHQGLEAASKIEPRLGADTQPRPRPRRKSRTGSRLLTASYEYEFFLVLTVAWMQRDEHVVRGPCDFNVIPVHIGLGFRLGNALGSGPGGLDFGLGLGNWWREADSHSIGELCFIKKGCTSS